MFGGQGDLWIFRGDEKPMLGTKIMGIEGRTLGNVCVCVCSHTCVDGRREINKS